MFAPWFERLARDLLAPAAVTSDRLRLLQWALFGLVKRLDEEGTFDGGWLDRTAKEIDETVSRDAATDIEHRLRAHLQQLTHA